MKQALKNSKPYDELFTPRYAIEPILKYIPRTVKTIWCPCDTEDSNIYKMLVENGYCVYVSHIDYGYDFLKYDLTNYDMIITNPPFSIKDKIIERCYYLKKPFALLLPLTALEGSKRNKLFSEGIGCVVLDKRIDFNGKGNCWYNTSWFIHSTFTDGRLFFEKVKDKEDDKAP